MAAFNNLPDAKQQADRMANRFGQPILVVKLDEAAYVTGEAPRLAATLPDDLEVVYIAKYTGPMPEPRPIGSRFD